MGGRIGLGIAGCGAIAGFAALVSKVIPQIRVAACCDSDPGRAEAFARRHRVGTVCPDLIAMLAAPGVDAVYLAVPHDMHLGMALSCIEAGRPVLVEKPLARTPTEGVELVDRARVAGVKVGVNYQYRYDSGCYALAQAARAGDLGRIHSVRINVPWRRERSYFERSPWHGTIARAGGGTLITQGSHFLDTALWALGEAPVSAVGYIARPGFDVEVETLAHGIVETAGGALVQICSSMASAREDAVTIEVYGERVTGRYTDRPVPRVRFEGGRVTRRRPPERGVHALARSLTGFARWVLEDGPFLVPAQEALPVLAAVDAIYRSAASGRREEIARR